MFWLFNLMLTLYAMKELAEILVRKKLKIAANIVQQKSFVFH